MDKDRYTDRQRPNHQTPNTSCLLSTGDPASSLTPARVKKKKKRKKHVSNRGLGSSVHFLA